MTDSLVRGPTTDQRPGAADDLSPDRLTERVRELAASGLQLFDIATLLRVHPAQIRRLLEQHEGAAMKKLSGPSPIERNARSATRDKPLETGAPDVRRPRET